MCRRVRRVIPGMVPSHRRPCGMRKSISLTRTQDTTTLSLIRGKGKRKVKFEEKKGQDAEMEGRISQTLAVLAQHQCSPNRTYLAPSPTPASTGARDLRLPSFAASPTRARRYWSATRLPARASSEKTADHLTPRALLEPKLTARRIPVPVARSIPSTTESGHSTHSALCGWSSAQDPLSACSRHADSSHTASRVILRPQRGRPGPPPPPRRPVPAEGSRSFTLH